jgi:hypothetical protein
MSLISYISSSPKQMSELCESTTNLESCRLYTMDTKHITHATTHAIYTLLHILVSFYHKLAQHYITMTNSATNVATHNAGKRWQMVNTILNISTTIGTRSRNYTRNGGPQHHHDEASLNERMNKRI